MRQQDSCGPTDAPQIPKKGDWRAQSLRIAVVIGNVFAAALSLASWTLIVGDAAVYVAGWGMLVALCVQAGLTTLLEDLQQPVSLRSRVISWIILVTLFISAGAAVA